MKMNKLKAICLIAMAAGIVTSCGKKSEDNENKDSVRVEQVKVTTLKTQEINRIVDIVRKNLVEFIDPLFAIFTVCADQSIHGKNILAVVMGKGTFLFNSFSEPVIVDNVVGTDQPCQIECLTWCIHSNCMIFGIFIDRLYSNVLASVDHQIRPDFISDNIDMMTFKDFHALEKFFLCPYTSTWVVRITDDCSMDLMIDDLLFHVFIIHSPHTFFITIKRGVNNVVTVVFDRSSKAYIGR